MTDQHPNKATSRHDILSEPLTDKQAREMLSAFFDATTTVDDELRLYAYFAMGPVAPDLQPYTRLMLAFADGGAPEGCTVKKHSLQKAPVIGWWMNMWRRCGAAAIAVLVGLSAWSSIVEHRNLQATVAQYEGSYVMIEGKKVTDLPVVLASMEQTRRQGNELIRDHLRRLNPATSPSDSIVASILADILNND